MSNNGKGLPKGRVWISTAISATLCAAAFGQLAVTPALPEKAWTRKMWLARFDAKKALAKQEKFDIVFLGDSITHWWEGPGSNVWARNFAQGEYKSLNCGISGDRTEHILWRLGNGQLANLAPKAFVLMIGTNNTGHRDVESESPTDTILGIQSIVDRLKAKYPESKIVLHPIFPRGATVNDPNRIRNDLVNSEIKAFADGKQVLWCDFNSRLLSTNGVMETSMAKDLLHPGEPGYVIWAEELKPYLDYALGKTKKAPMCKAPPAPTALAKNVPATAIPKIQNRWLNSPNPKVSRRIRAKRAEQCANTERYYDVIMIGDSITHYWELGDNKAVFEEKFKGYKVFNAGFGGARTQNALWNILHGGVLDGVHARMITLMIGTNNSWGDSPENIATGIKACVEAIRKKQPQAKLLLMPLLPRELVNKRANRDYARKNGEIVMPKHAKVNELIRPLADGKDIIWFDLTKQFTDADGLADIKLLPDGTHPGPEGCVVWGDAIQPYLKKFCGK